MIERLGIIPAAGKAERWGGMPKELIPIGNETLLDRTVLAMENGKADAIMLITNTEKAPLHIQHLKNKPILYKIQQGKKDLWSAICESFSIGASMNYFAMPDTYFNTDIFGKMSRLDFNIGYFETREPERFGVISEYEIIDKQPTGGVQKAWGVLSWSYKVAEFWTLFMDQIETHTQAFNMAISQFGFSMTKLDYYHDVANYEYYKRLINGI